MYENGHGVKQDYSEALKWRQKSANQEEETGQLSLGRMYENGHGVKQDYVEAYKWIFLGAENGFEKATKELPLLETHMTPEKILEAKKRAENWKPEGK
jgi:TPR repeat protein